MVSQVKKIKVIIVKSEIESLLLEARLIKKHKPKYNIKLIDSKGYPFIRITVKNKYQSVLITRKKDDLNSIYFGPYPDVKAVKLTLRILRKIFPFQSVLNHPKNLCLYNHLNLCLCQNVLPENLKVARSNIKNIIYFLNGNSKKILKDLIKERGNESKNENFEKAQESQNKILAIEKIINPATRSFEYETNPNLIYEQKEKQIKELMKILNENGVQTNYLHRIECYDISNTQGTNPVSSMVVLTNGEIDKKNYRKFKIETVGPNDFKMLEETLLRRFKHQEWLYPNLIVVDGGKGQVTSAKKALKKASIKIPIIGLAKKFETIVTKNLKEISLPKDNIGLQLILKIRDEAHRFAITYHKKIRNKKEFE